MLEIIFKMLRYILPALAVLILSICAIALLANRPKIYTMAKLINAINGDEIPLKYWETSLGRSKACDVMMSYGAISRFHAVISRRKNTWVVTDTFSKTGVYVNGEKIDKKSVINDGDSLSFGPVVMFFRINKAEENNENVHPLADPKSNTQELPDLNIVIPQRHSGAKITHFEDVYTNFENVSSGKKQEDVDLNGKPAFLMKATREVCYVSSDVCLIGRLVECDIQLNYQTVALNHAKLTVSDEGFVIENLDDNYETFVNGSKVTGKQLLLDGDNVVIGGIGMIFYSSYISERSGDV